MDISFNPYVGFAWSILVGFMMSMGAGGGGILAGIGHISLLGVSDVNTIKVVNQILALVSRAVSVPLYHRQRRLVWPLAVSYGIGAPAGAAAGSWFSKTYLSDMNVYRFVFGILVSIVAASVLYEGSAKRRRRREQEIRNASDREEGAGDRGTADKRRLNYTPQVVRFTLWSTTIRFAGESFHFNPVAAAAGGVVIGFIGSAIGVGGGFLVTPFMAIVLLLPMFLVVGTGLVALMIPLVVSVATYLLLQVHVDWHLLAVETPGVACGSIIGPLLNRYMNENVLRTFLAITLLAIGIYYML